MVIFRSAKRKKIKSDYRSRLFGFQDLRTFPTSETDAPLSGPSSYPVIRVMSRFPGIKTGHVRQAIQSFLAARGVTLPSDTGAGPCALTVRLEPAALAKAMRLSGASSRCALIRRLIYWKFYQQRAEAEAAKRAAAKQPVAGPKLPSARRNGPVAASYTSLPSIPEKKTVVPVPRCPAQGEARLRFDQVTPLFSTYGYSFLPQSNCIYTLDSNGIIRQYDGNGKVMQTWEKPNFG